MISLEAYIQLFSEHGGTDSGYLRKHWSRFRNTKEIFEQGAAHAMPQRVLDVGAHWLHQALLFAIDGYQVTALDLPETMESSNVVRLADAHNIRLVACRDLAQPTGLAQVPDGSFDVVIFGEILEHITFNPLALWREIYRVLSEGGTIVVTTPNYYAATRRRFKELRILTGGGSGITVDEILATPSHGHHWKEYSRQEVERYFLMLSPDFVIYRSIYVEDLPLTNASLPQRLAARMRGSIPPLRSRLHLEVRLARKHSGIVIEPHW